MQVTQHPETRASLFVLVVALGYCAYNYFSGDFGSLGFVLRLTKNPTALAWPVLRACFMLQVLIAITSLGLWRRPRALRRCSIFSISLAVLIHSVQVASLISLAFNPRVKQEWTIAPIVLVLSVLLISCLVFSLTRTKLAEHDH